MKKVTATEANRSFSKLLARAAKGKSTAITVRGKLVARLEPARGGARNAKTEALWQQFLQRLREQPVLNLPRLTRDELYD
jgi:prevent-host-death family protein